MKRKLSSLIETAFFCGVVTWLSPKHPTRLSNPDTVCIICLAFTLAVTVSVIMETYVIRKAQILGSSSSWSRRAAVSLLNFLTTSLAFGCAFALTEYFGNLPASFRTFFSLSILASLNHLIFGAVFARVTEQGNNSLPYQDDDKGAESKEDRR